ncbi:DUF6234 family protein [Streptomyces sp. NPDC050856]|uniref:DUF6234 family protein n=1 Tax=Streptomyces sp. NPDC050856 TaxID=3154939 RepID=UPI0033C34775
MRRQYTAAIHAPHLSRVPQPLHGSSARRPRPDRRGASCTLVRVSVLLTAAFVMAVLAAIFRACWTVITHLLVTLLAGGVLAITQHKWDSSHTPPRCTRCFVKPQEPELLDALFLSVGRALHLATADENKCQYVLRVGNLITAHRADPAGTFEKAIASRR